MINSIESTEFKKRIKVRFNNILEGFDEWNYKTLSFIGDTIDEEEKNNLKEQLFKEQNRLECLFLNFFKIFFEKECKEKMFFDFYIDRLNEEAIKKIKERLNQNEIIEFENLLLDLNGDGPIFRLNDLRYLEILLKLSMRELFFITFYIESMDITIWSNYNMEFLIFYDKQSSIHLIDKYAEEYNIFLY